MWIARKEAWSKMLITSQLNTPPRSSKTYPTKLRNGVQIVQFRGTDDSDNNKIGRLMPILNAADELGQALIREVHTIKRYKYHPIHRSIDGSLTALSRGPMKVWIPGASH